MRGVANFPLCTVTTTSAVFLPFYPSALELLHNVELVPPWSAG